MLDFIGTIGLTAAMMVTVSALVAAWSIRKHRLQLALVLGAWAGTVAALASIGEFADAGRRAVPLVGVMFALPLVATALVAALSARVRATLLALPLPLLIGLNIWRVLGLMFVLLAADGRLGGPFPQSAGWGDVIAGALAVPVALLAVRGAAAHRWAIAAWNAFGTLDLVVAVTLGVVSTNGGSLQLIHAGAGSAAMQQLPWAFVPTMLVPLFLIMHGVIFAQLRTAVAQDRLRAQPSGAFDVARAPHAAR